jgi:hypothetical protein
MTTPNPAASKGSGDHAMKKILLSLAAVGAIAAAAAPAAAQPWSGRADAYQDSYRAPRLADSRIERLDWRITRAAREGRIGWDEARALRHEVREVRPLAWRVQAGEADRWEAARLDRTIRRIEWAVDSRGGDDRYDRHDRYDGWRR